MNGIRQGKGRSVGCGSQLLLIRFEQHFHRFVIAEGHHLNLSLVDISPASHFLSARPEQNVCHLFHPRFVRCIHQFRRRRKQISNILLSIFVLTGRNRFQLGPQRIDLGLQKFPLGAQPGSERTTTIPNQYKKHRMNMSGTSIHAEIE